MHKRRTIYLDHHATTPTDRAVLGAMLPYFAEEFGNASGVETPSGRRAANAVREARASVARLLGAESAEIVFTSGATEAINLAMLGTVHRLRSSSVRRKIVTTRIEHKAVLECCSAAQGEGLVVEFMSLLPTGRVDVQAARESIDESTLLVSVQAANNEIGTLQPIAELAEIAHECGALFHTDAAQAVGKLAVDVSSWGIDLLSLSAHKFYGPKGVGALYVRNGVRNFPISPILYGGGQEFGVRAGTLNVPAIVGLGVAAECVLFEDAWKPERLARVRDAFEGRLRALTPSVTINGDLGNRLPNNSSVTFSGVDAHALIANLPTVELSTGSACSNGAPEPSYVLQEVGLSRGDAASTLRIGFGKGNSESDATFAAEQIAKAVLALGGG